MSWMEMEGPEGKYEGGSGREEQRGEQPKAAASLWWRLGYKDDEFLALEERAGCSRAVSLLMPLKDPSGLCCCLGEGSGSFSLAVFVPFDWEAGKSHLSSPSPSCQLQTPNQLIRINVSDQDKGDF